MPMTLNPWLVNVPGWVSHFLRGKYLVSLSGKGGGWIRWSLRSLLVMHMTLNTQWHFYSQDTLTLIPLGAGTEWVFHHVKYLFQGSDLCASLFLWVELQDVPNYLKRFNSYKNFRVKLFFVLLHLNLLKYRLSSLSFFRSDACDECCFLPVPLLTSM